MKVVLAIPLVALILSGCSPQAAPEAPSLGTGSIPASCQRWFDGCNTCFRSENGDVGCSRRACPHGLEPARCLDDET